jgi:hypothetical protein
VSTARETTEDVHRLHDIVVEEVSLVDRAANKHRFLIVKRSDPMADEETKIPEAAAPEPQGTEKQSEPAPETKADGAGYGADSHMLEAAVEALERLTETVETLGALADGDARAKLAEIAGELRALADRVASAAGAEAAPAAESPTEAADELGAVMASVRATLEQVGSLLGEAKRAPAKPKEKDDADGGKTEKREVAPESAAPAADDPLHKDLAALTQAMTKLADAVKEQQQRLSKLEKRFGLPNSAPAREHPETPEPEDVGWPLDLNRPFDRENVDKAVSFHDL